MPDVPSLSCGEKLISSNAISLLRKRDRFKNHLFFSHHFTGHPDREREGTPLPLLRKGIQLSQSRYLILDL